MGNIFFGPPCIRILDFDWLIAGVFSYLGLISFISTAAGVFASNRQIHSEYFFLNFIRKVT
jgi:hypothetical protein